MYVRAGAHLDPAVHFLGELLISLTIFFFCLVGNKSPSSWLGDVLKKQDSSFLINKFEGGGNQDDNLSGILSYPTLHHLQEPFSVRAVVQWMDMLLAALDCYNTFIEQRMFKPENVLGK